jgi:Tol biopolymer transport system component
VIPIRSQPRPTFARTAPIDAKGQVLFTSSLLENKLFVADPQPHWPSWSPDGTQLAYERYAGTQHHNIWVVDLSSGATTPVVTSSVDDPTPSWSR